MGIFDKLFNQGAKVPAETPVRNREPTADENPYRRRLDELRDNAGRFWAEWQQAEERLSKLSDAQEFVGAANELLHRHCPGVLVELGGQTADGALVFSANGVLEHFPQVQALAEAPATQRQVSVFRQRLGMAEQFGIRMGGVGLQTDDILVHCEAWNGMPALEIAFAKPFTGEKRQTAQHMFLIMLDHVLGEWDAVVKVGAVDFVDEEPPEAVPLHRLPEKLDGVWKALGRNALYPQPEWSFRAYQCDEDEEAGRDAMVLLRNESANGLLGRADMCWCVSVACEISDEDALVEAYRLQDEFDAAACYQQQGINTLAVTNLSRGVRTVYAATGEPECLLEKVQAVCAQFAHLKAQADCEYDPSWRHYRF